MCITPAALLPFTLPLLYLAFRIESFQNVSAMLVIFNLEKEKIIQSVLVNGSLISHSF